MNSDDEVRPIRLNSPGFGSVGRRETESRYAGLVRSMRLVETCSVAVITGDVGQAVRAAGGWMCDRVRAGWTVTAFVPAGCDTTPLQILGIRTAVLGAGSDCPSLTPTPATLAIGTEVLSFPTPISDQVRALMRDHATEITVWGEGEIPACQRFHEVHHRLSLAARSFKRYAMRAASLSETAAPTEFLRSCSPWYPVDQVVDLNTVNIGGGDPAARPSAR